MRAVLLDRVTSEHIWNTFGARRISDLVPDRLAHGASRAAARLLSRNGFDAQEAAPAGLSAEFPNELLDVCVCVAIVLVQAIV